MSSYQNSWEHLGLEPEERAAAQLTEHLHSRGVKSDEVQSMHSQHRANHALLAGVQSPNEAVWQRVTKGLAFRERQELRFKPKSEGGGGEDLFEGL